MKLQQMALPFDPAPRFEAADFIAAPSNAAARAWLARPAAWPLRRLALWGPAGCGKTHLLHVWATANGAEILRGGDLAADLLPDLPAGPRAIDEADRAPELALLRLLNTAAEAGQAVLLAARTPPGRWPISLPDLASRLRAITAAEIAPAEDDLLRLLLQRLLIDRQMAVAEPVQDLLLRRLPRTPAALRSVVARLDRAALERGGKVTRPLACAAVAALALLPDDDIAGEPADPLSPSAGTDL